MTEAIILVGGEGLRLRPLTDTRPKPMMTLVDRPFVQHQLDHLRRVGVEHVIFSCGYRPEALEGHFGDRDAGGIRLSYVVDPIPLGTAGAIKNAQPLLSSDRTLVLNGDVLTDLDVAAMIARHERSEVAGTLALTPVDDPSRFGLVRLLEDCRVEEFLEKPRPDELRPGEPFLINAGTYLLSREVLDLIPPGRACSIERDIFPVLAGRRRLAGFPSESYWRDIGTHESYLQAHLDVLAGAVRTDVPTGDRYLGPGAALDPAATVTGGATLGAGSTVGAGAVVEASVVGDEATIGPGARVTGAIVGAGVHVGAGARLQHGVVIGDGARIAEGTTLRDVVVPTGEAVDADWKPEEARNGDA